MPSAAPGDAEAGCALQNRVFAAAEGGGGSLRAVGSTHQGRAPQAAGEAPRTASSASGRDRAATSRARASRGELPELIPPDGAGLGRRDW